MNVQADVALLRSWAPKILQQGESASLDDLKEIIALRARLEAAQEPALWRAIRQGDEKCDRFCHTLLYLPGDQVPGSPPETRWDGVHSWDLVQDGVLHWAGQISRERGQVHPAEVLEVYRDLERQTNRAQVSSLFGREHSTWKKRLDEPELDQVWENILTLRSAG